MDRVRRHEEAMAEYAYDRLNEFDDIEIYGPPGDDRSGLVAFNLESVHAHDLASIINDSGVAIRAGDHCTQPLHDKLGVAASRPRVVLHLQHAGGSGRADRGDGRGAAAVRVIPR